MKTGIYELDEEFSIVANSFFCLFSEKHLIKASKMLYSSIVKDYNSFQTVFEDQFNVAQKLVFGPYRNEDILFFLLSKYYRNEYFVKKAFQKKNSIIESANYLEEIPICSSRLDLASFENNSYAFEIKTAYDTLERLPKQISDYSKCFEFVYVICSDDKIKHVKNIIPNDCGLIYYTNRKNCTFKLLKEANKSKSISSSAQLSIMRKNEKINFFGISELDLIRKTFSKEEINICFKNCLKLRHHYCK